MAHPRPLYRSRAFWLGVLVIIFLGCSWKRSIHYYDVFSYGEATGGRGLSFGQRNSLFIATWIPAKAPAGFIPGFHRFSIMMKGSNRTAFPSLFAEDIPTQELPPYFRSFRLPHWLVMLLFLFGWTIFLTLRGQRMKRLTADPSSTRLPSQ